MLIYQGEPPYSPCSHLDRPAPTAHVNRRSTEQKTNLVKRKKAALHAARSPGKLESKAGLHHPLGLMLDKFRTAETMWVQQKAELRRAMESHKKRADKAEMELKKLQVNHAGPQPSKAWQLHSSFMFGIRETKVGHAHSSVPGFKLPVPGAL